MRLNRWGLATIMPFWMIARSRYFRPRPVPSQAKFTVRTEAYKLQDSITGLPVDQHQVGLDVAVSMISPFAGQSVVTLLSAQRLILGKHLQDFNDYLRHSQSDRLRRLKIDDQNESRRSLDRKVART